MGYVRLHQARRSPAVGVGALDAMLRPQVPFNVVPSPPVTC